MRLDYSEFGSALISLERIAGLELLKNILAVTVYSIDADREHLGNLFAQMPFCYILENLFFARRENVRIVLFGEQLCFASGEVYHSSAMKIGAGERV